MGSKKDIGKAYKEQLESYTSSPHNRVWENIEAELKKSKRRGFPIWKTLTGIGILLLLLTSYGVYRYYATPSSSLEDNNPIKIENTTNQNGSTHKNKSNENSDKLKENTITDVNKDNNDLNKDSNQDASETNTLSNTNQNNTKKDKNNIITSTPKGSSKKAIQNGSINNNNTGITSELTKGTAFKKGRSSNRQNGTVKSSRDKVGFANKGVTNNIDEVAKSLDSIRMQSYPVVLFDIDGLTKLEGEKEKPKKKKTKKKSKPTETPLVVSAYVMPTYFTTSGKSSIDKLLDNNKRSGGFHLNYGVSATIKISKKSSLRLGIGKLDASYTIKGADTTGTDGLLLNALNYDNLTVNTDNFNNTPENFGANTIVDFKQKFNYLEIPIDYIYHLREDTKFKVNLSGGFSVLSLSSQGVFAEANGTSVEIGKGENLRKTNFSFNFGGQLSYSLSKKINLDFEPVFKYYLATFSNDVDVQPFSFGIRLGLTYKF